MKIYLHIGPHKTGTTSLQQWLSEVLPNNKVYYPKPQKFGPGHAELSWDALGLNGREMKGHHILSKQVRKAHEARCESIIFSSEEFCRGFVRGFVRPLARLKEDGELCVILTLNDLVDRFRSEVFEQIKHKAHHPNISQADVVKYIKMRPGLMPNLVAQVLERIAPDRLVICISNKKNHRFLFDCFSGILGIEAPERKKYFVNRSLSFNAVMVLNAFNGLYPNLDTESIKRLAYKSVELIESKCPTLASQTFSGFSEETEFLLSSIWQLQCDHIQLLAEQGKIELLQD